MTIKSKQQIEQMTTLSVEQKKELCTYLGRAQGRNKDYVIECDGDGADSLLAWWHQHQHKAAARSQKRTSRQPRQNHPTLQVFKTEHISKLNAIFDEYVLNSTITIEDKMKGCRTGKHITSCPQSPIVKIASIVTGRTDGELFAEAFNSTSTDYTIKAGTINKNTKVSTITIIRTNEVSYNRHGRYYKYFKNQNMLESVGGSVKITQLPNCNVEQAFTYLDIIKTDSIGCTFCELAVRVANRFMYISKYKQKRNSKKVKSFELY